MLSDCTPYFSGGVTGIANIVFQEVDGVSELIGVNAELATVNYDTSALSTPTLDEDAVDTDEGRIYLEGIVDDTNGAVTLTVKQDMEGLPDYPDSTVSVYL